MAQVAILDLQEPPEGSGSTLPQIAALEEYWHSEQADAYDECARWIERELGDEPQGEAGAGAEAAGLSLPGLLAGAVPGAAPPPAAPLAGLGVHGGLRFLDWDACWDYARGRCRHGDRCNWRHEKGPKKPDQPARAEDEAPPGEEDVDETDHGIDAFDDPEAAAAEADEPLSGAAAELADAMRGQKAAQLLRAKLRDGEFEGYEAWETALDIQEAQLADQEAQLRTANRARLQAEAQRREEARGTKERQGEQEALALQSQREAAEVEEAKRQHEIRMSHAAKEAEARRRAARGGGAPAGGGQAPARGAGAAAGGVQETRGGPGCAEAAGSQGGGGGQGRGDGRGRGAARAARGGEGPDRRRETDGRRQRP